jgi:hypothetical protein
VKYAPIWIDSPFIPRLIAIRRFYAAFFPPVARHYRAMKVQTLKQGVSSMNNRNQQPTRPVQQPLPGSVPTHLNVFTVEEYESNGKSGKRWTKVGAAFPHKEGSGFSIELSAIPLDGRLVVLPPADDDGRNGK